MEDFINLGQRASKNRELFLEEHPEVREQVEIVKGRAIQQMFPLSSESKPSVADKSVADKPLVRFSHLDFLVITFLLRRAIMIY